MATNKVNWMLIANLPADGVVYQGSPEYGAFRVRHLPYTRLKCEQILAETSEGLMRRRLVPRKGKPYSWAAVELISGQITA